MLALTRGKDTVELHFDYEGETIWATQNTIAELFATSKQNISKHIAKIYQEKELLPDRTVNQKLTVQNEGSRQVKREVDFYNLDVIIAVGYRINSKIATCFRQWATARLNEFIIKGFTMDDNRLKKHGSRYFDELIARIRDIRSSERNLYQKVTDIYATAIDYEYNLDISKTFFATVQNKMHFAVTGKTAAEIIYERANSALPYMGLLSFKGKYLIQADIAIAKNYLNEEELQSLNLLVDAYLSFAEIQATRRVAMRMADWVKKLDEYLHFASYEVLNNTGKISHDQALKKANKEYAKYSGKLMKDFESDFDREVKKLLEIKKKK
ncbi:MAG: cell filamentation protein Fic [Candidatus Moranbacteria bacterium RIFOXYA12_FULL_35_19]|nr:MAG: cell filamentation protein Fic [Candidatus Moranbacteria bacterium RIFOXYB12_FULL_35_8]OGI32445.1 MAG: cell filamentation protein Fic [Candidatus Moranbacteria bacterium RIFOXYC12_FULL_36_13]OGI35529.1 MAG: cell filamentation protein Fic [Candidatus Moranbacteria bacterium RIFOXYA12_FULL_35_19]